MRQIMRYEGYSSKERVDDILDKISLYSISSLTDLELEFLDAYSKGNYKEIHKKLAQKEYENIFEDDNGYFKFEAKDIKYYNNEIHLIGTLYVPDIKLKKGKRIDGCLNGKIIYYKNGTTSPVFFKKTQNRAYDIFEFCNGLEYELDVFIDYIIKELVKKENI
jgi:hypothetical protein